MLRTEVDDQAKIAQFAGHRVKVTGTLTASGIKVAKIKTCCGVCLGLMAAALSTRKRGNPNWGRPIPPVPAIGTEFELQVKRLHLKPQMYTSSRELRIWCRQNRNRVYIPEWLLEEWRITVDPLFTGAA